MAQAHGTLNTAIRKYVGFFSPRSTCGELNSSSIDSNSPSMIPVMVGYVDSRCQTEATTDSGI